MEWFIETRFGDPVLSLHLRSSGLVYGTALGQIGYFDIPLKTHTILTELAEESIRGIFLAAESVIYAAVGDLYVICFYKSQQDEAWSYDPLSHEGRVHTSVLCHATQIFQHGPKVCLILTEEEIDVLSSHCQPQCFITDADASETKEFKGLILPKHAVPLAFNEDRLLWLDRSPGGQQALHLISFAPFAEHCFKSFEARDGQLAHFHLFEEVVFFVRNFRTVCLVSVVGDGVVQVLGRHSADIAAICPVRTSGSPEGSSVRDPMFQPGDVVVSVDVQGVLRIWSKGGLLEEIAVTSHAKVAIDHAERLFALGYPYCLAVSSPYIAFSTDLGIFLVISRYLRNLEGDVELYENSGHQTN